ncbi:MAG: sigma-70 family RNA polymerase sigma factor [Bacteroidota bacterium]
MSGTTNSAELLLADLRAGGAAQEKAIGVIYDKHYAFIYKMIKENRISEEEAIDAYSDAVVAFRRQVVSGTFRGESSYATYLYRIFLNKCLNAIRKRGTNKVEWEYELPLHLQDREPQIIQLLEVREKMEDLSRYLGKLGQNCKEILLDAIYWGYRMEEIAQRYGYKDAKTVRVKKHTCLQQLRKLMS